MTYIFISELPKVTYMYVILKDFSISDIPSFQHVTYMFISKLPQMTYCIQL